MKHTLHRAIAFLFGSIRLVALAPAATAQLPDPGLDIDPHRTALVITDPQNDFLSPEGVKSAAAPAAN